MKKLSLIFALLFASSAVYAGGAQSQQLDDSTKANQESIDKGLFGNPYMPNVSCNYNTQKLWFNGTTKKWQCVNDRTKTGS